MKDETRHIKTLERRLHHLNARINYMSDQGKDRSYDLAERAALRWAISKLKTAARDRRIEELEAEVKKVRDELGVLTDHVVHYRNMAIRLGATARDMMNEYDRSLCRRGLVTGDDGGWDANIRECWDAADTAESRIAELESLVKRQAAAHDDTLDLAESAESRVAELEAAYKSAVHALVDVFSHICPGWTCDTGNPAQMASAIKRRLAAESARRGGKVE